MTERRGQLGRLTASGLSLIVGLVAGLATVAGVALAHVNVNCPTGINGECTGDEHDNDIDGTGNQDNINARDGHDKAVAKAGADDFSGSVGQDKVKGGDHDDTLFGGNGADFWINCGPDDSDCGLDGGAGGDYADGGDGADYVRGDGGNDRLYGGANDDEIRAANDGAWDLVYGGGGDGDRCYADEFVDLVQDCEYGNGW